MAKLLVTALKMIPTAAAVNLPLSAKYFAPDGTFASEETQAKAAATMLDELAALDERAPGAARVRLLIW